MLKKISHPMRKIANYFSSLVVLFIAGFLFFGNDVTMAGGCYMPRVAMWGTAKAKQAVYMRSMPCMEEGQYIATAKSQEVMTISMESDGRYQLTRADGTVGRIYYTWLTDIQTSQATSSSEAPKPISQENTLSTSVKKQLDNFIKQLFTFYPDQVDYNGNLTRHSKVEEIYQKLLILKDKTIKWKLVVEYLIEKIEKN